MFTFQFVFEVVVYQKWFMSHVYLKDVFITEVLVVLQKIKTFTFLIFNISLQAREIFQWHTIH